MSGILNSNGIIVRQGDSFAINLHFHDEQGDIDLTEANIKMSVRDENRTKLIDKSGAISDAAKGLAVIELQPSDTNITPGDYETDIQIQFADGQIHTVYPQNVNTVAYFRITPQITE